MKKRGLRSFLLLFFFSLCFMESGYSQAESKTPGVKADSTFKRKQTGYYNVTTISLLTFTGQFLPGVQTISGYRINKYLSVGGGIGYEWYKSIPTYDIFTADLSLLPVFADVRFTPLSGKITPVIAVNGGYKILLNKPSTQVRQDSVFGNVLFVESKNIYSEHTVFTSGGFFFTAEIGGKAMISKKMSAYLSVDYSLWTISGTYYLSEKEYLLGSTGHWALVGTNESTEKTIAYVHAFLLRLGITF